MDNDGNPEACPMKNDHLVQTMVSEDLATSMKRAADAEGISVAAFVRRLIIRWSVSDEKKVRK
jgi:hypothetical protein